MRLHCVMARWTNGAQPCPSNPAMAQRRSRGAGAVADHWHAGRGCLACRMGWWACACRLGGGAVHHCSGASIRCYQRGAGNSCRARACATQVSRATVAYHVAGRAFLAARDRCRSWPSCCFRPRRCVERCSDRPWLFASFNFWHARCSSGACLLQFTAGDPVYPARMAVDPVREVPVGGNIECPRRAIAGMADVARGLARHVSCHLFDLPDQLCCGPDDGRWTARHND